MARVDYDDDDDLAYESTYMDIALPHEWKRVAHESGLFCFLHEPTGVVSWSQPYVVQLIDRHGRATLDEMVQAHRPPIEIFAAGCGMRQPDLNRPVKIVQAESILRRLNQAARSPSTHKDESAAKPADARRHHDQPKPRPAPEPPAVPTTSRKRPHPDDQGPATDKTSASPASAAPLEASSDRVMVGDVAMENPAGKTAAVVLIDYLAAAARPGPEFVQTVSDDPALPFRCGVLLNGEEVSHATDTTRAAARQRAAELALETLLPGYWAGLKKDGLVADVVSNPAPSATNDWTKPSLAATTLDDFESMAIDHPGVLQGCMDLSFKTPAQLLMEFQTKNKGIAVNYSTMTIPGDSKGDRNTFKVTASVGPSAAEGLAGNKKVAKQFAAQALLAQLNPRVTTYYDLIRLHENTVKHHADGANRAKLQKLATRYGGGAAAPGPSVPVQPALLPPPTPSLVVSAGGAPERPSPGSNYGRGGYGHEQVANSYSTGRDAGQPPRRGHGNEYGGNVQGYGAHSVVQHQYGHGGGFHGQYDSQPQRTHQAPPPAQLAPYSAYTPAHQIPASAYEYSYVGPPPPRPLGRPSPQPQGWHQQQYPPRSPSRNGGVLPSPQQHQGYGHQGYGQPPSSAIQQIRSDLRHSLQR